MPLHPSLLKKVPEASYLIAENAFRYRPIMRHFYLQHGLHRFRLSLEEVRDYVRAEIDPDYTDELAEQDLRQLVEWQVLTAEQDRARVRTVDEWLRRRLQYQITPVGIAFERLLAELEREHGTGGSLDPTNLDSLWFKLNELERALAPDAIAPESQEYLRSLRRLWLDAYSYFDSIGKDSADYLASMHRARPEDLNELEAFLAFKDVLLQYLDSFLTSLMDYSDRIQALLGHWTARGLPDRLISLLVIHDTRYEVDATGLPAEGAAVRARYTQQWEAMAAWFRRQGGAHMLRSTTADAIEMVVRHSQRLMERQRFGMGRRRELEELARSFSACRSLDDAERLSALSYGFVAPRHLLGSLEGHAMPERQSVWSGAPIEVPLGRVKGGRQSRGRSEPMRDVAVEQQMALVEELERRRQEAALWDRLFTRGVVSLGDLAVHDDGLRARLLDLLGRCIASSDGTALASDGSVIRLSLEKERTTGRLVSPAGELLMPRFQLQREPEGGGGR